MARYEIIFIVSPKEGFPKVMSFAPFAVKLPCQESGFNAKDARITPRETQI